MYSILRFIALIALLFTETGITKTVHLPKSTQKYLHLFSQKDPEMVFHDDKFDTNAFEKAYQRIFSVLQTHPDDVDAKKFRDFVSLLRAIISYWRFDSDIPEKLKKLPL